MSLRSLVILALLVVLPVTACATTSKNSTAIDDIQRRHDDMMNGM
jgi:hypothetical protein